MIKAYLDQPLLIDKVFSFEEIESKLSPGNQIRLMMGQTYDDGQPADLLKYSLFIMNLQDLLRQQGVDSTACILLADHFLTDINQEMSDNSAFIYGVRRWNFLDLINFAFHGNISIMFSSSLADTGSYQRILMRLEEQSEKDSQFRQLLLEAVPEDRRKTEKVLEYPLHELACISSLDTDIRIGPRQEFSYDVAARESFPQVGLKKYCAIYLTNSYPLGDHSVPRSKLPFGVLPYKLRSKGLQDLRIDLASFSTQQISALIDSATSRDALLDLLVIADMARQRIETSIQPTDCDIFFACSLPRLRDLAKEYFSKYITKVFEKSEKKETV
ncbi:hypothetical protein LR013_01870 [candidate division NPL-UPA2 bacterium]|nr:hypothetical protein [candidate division NPL-UPA2 bacterium]